MLQTEQSEPNSPRPQYRAGAKVGKRRAAAATAAIACSVALLTAVSASAGASSFKASRSPLSTTKPDLAYYKGKTINMYTFASPGQAVDLEERVLAPYISAYLHCQIIIHNLSGGGSLPGQNVPALSAPDGLTIGQANLVGDIGDFVNNTPGLQFSVRSIPYLAALGSLNFVEISSPSSGIKSFAQLVGSKTPVSTIYAQTSTAGVYTSLLYGSFHIDAKYITGYAGAAQVLQGYVRGDGATLFNAFSSLQPLILQGQAVPLLQTDAPLKAEKGYAIMKKVPLLSAYAAAHPPKTNNEKQELAITKDLLFLASPFYVPVGTPAKYQAALNDAIEWAASRGGAKQQLVADGLPVNVVLPGAVKSAVNAVIKHQQQLTSWLPSGA